MADGRLNKCRTCVLEAVNKWRKKNPGCRKKEHARLRERAGFSTREEYFNRLKENAIGRKVSSLKYAHKRRQVTEQEMSEFDAFVLEEAFALRELRSELTGIKWHVDHIVPLHHKKACGLHAAANIQVVPAYFNLKKGNRHMEAWNYE
jgi:hypothetical protein